MSEPLTVRQTLSAMKEVLDEKEISDFLFTDPATVIQWIDGSREPNSAYRARIFSFGEIFSKIIKTGKDRATKELTEKYATEPERMEN